MTTALEMIDTFASVGLFVVFLWLYYRWSTGLVRTHERIYGISSLPIRHLTQLTPPHRSSTDPKDAEYRREYWRASGRFFLLSVAIWTVLYVLSDLRS